MPTRRRYSSTEGCCICGTNSSTEPFVNKEKVSQHNKCLVDIFENCFKLEEERKGDWCVTCKEIAKKWLRLNKARRNSTNFKKIVDSKRKPKPRTTRRSSRSIDLKDTNENKEVKNEDLSLPEKNVTAEQNGDTKIKVEEDAISIKIEDALSEDDNDDDVEDIAELDGSPLGGFDSPFDGPALPFGSANQKKTVTTGTQTSFLFPTLTSPQANANKLPFIDLSKWRQEEICCGTIFRGPNGEVLVDPKWLLPSCAMCNRSTQPPTPVQACGSEEISVFDEKLAGLCS